MTRSRKSIATNRGRRENGVALLMVLWVLMLLTVIVGEFCFTMRTRVNITRNFKESTEAYYLALAGLNRAVLEIIRQELTPPRIVTVEEKETEAETPDAAAPEWRMNLELPAMAFANGVFEARIENQSGKVNLNMAEKPLLSTMLEGFALDPADRDVIVDSILDWRDSDRNHRINGAEDDYYQSLSEPYDCKDADFDSPEELLLVRGVTPELYKAGLKDLITVLPKNKQPSGLGRTKKKEKGFDYNKLNVNAISPETWAALPGMTEELVAEIFVFRAERDFRTLGEVQEIVGADVFRDIAASLTLETTPYYKVSSFGAAGGGPIREGVSAVVEFNRNAPLYYRIMEWSEGISQ